MVNSHLQVQQCLVNSKARQCLVNSKNQARLRQPPQKRDTSAKNRLINCKGCRKAYATSHLMSFWRAGSASA